jgi:hypothetical protein
MFCDLHMHSTHSDGTMRPCELVAMARQKGLAAIALTDHDTVSGVDEAVAAGRDHGVRVLAGVEISIECTSKNVHVLGYCYDVSSARMRDRLDEIVRGRKERNLKITAKLNALGLAIAYDEVQAEAGGDVVGRPHFARVLERHGYVTDFREAFDKYLGSGGAAYVDRLRFSPEDSVALIRESGGVAVLAHPMLVGLRGSDTIEGIVGLLKDAGLQGLECYYAENTPEQTRESLELARRCGLQPTGGSDFHGGMKTDLEMGTGHGDLRVPVECADALERLAAGG